MATGRTTWDSYGRTKCPKNLTGTHGTEVASVTSAPTLTDATAGYSTENQRFLHILLDTSTSTNNRTITVWGFSHAFGRWAPLTDVRGNAVTTGAVNSSQAYKVFEIGGCDRVLFLANSAVAAGDFLFAACTTF